MKVIARANVAYRELGYVIMPLENDDEQEAKIQYEAAKVRYPRETVLILPIGSQISGAKSQNDAAEFNTLNDIIRIYGLIPKNEIKTEKHIIYIFDTGDDINIPYDAEKITICKEGRGEHIYHCYYVSATTIHNAQSIVVR